MRLCSRVVKVVQQFIIAAAASAGAVLSATTAAASSAVSAAAAIRFVFFEWIFFGSVRDAASKDAERSRRRKFHGFSTAQVVDRDLFQRTVDFGVFERRRFRRRDREWTVVLIGRQWRRRDRTQTPLVLVRKSIRRRRLFRSRTSVVVCRGKWRVERGWQWRKWWWWCRRRRASLRPEAEEFG